MIWLEAVLAFALTMLVFSTMVSVIVEAGLRILKMREKGFRNMLECLFEDVIEPRLESALQQPPMARSATAQAPETENGREAGPTEEAPKKAAQGRDDFVKTLTRNRAMRKDESRFLKLLREWFVPRENTTMTVMQFAERLADTEAGKAIARQGEERLEVLIKDLAQKFENIGEGAREYYARRAAMVSMVVAIVFAYAANIDAVRLFQTFVGDQKLTASIIARSEEVTDAYEKQQVEMEKLLKQIENAESAADAEEKAKPLEDLKATAEELREDLADLADQGLPITYSLYPICPAESKDRKCIAHREYLTSSYCAKPGKNGKYRGHESANECIEQESTLWSTLLHSRFMGLGWLLSVLLAGLLIGLGGPFWYNVVSSLSRVVQLARAAGVGAKPKPKEGAPATAEAAAKTEQPQNPVEAFKVAAQIVEGKPKLLAHW